MTERYSNIQDLIITNAYKYSAKTAFQILKKDNTFDRYSYSDAYQQAEIIASFFEHEEIKPQTPIGIYAPNCPHWAISFMGILLKNCIVVPIDSKSGSAEFNHIMKDTGLNYIFTTKKLYPNLPEKIVENVLVLDTDKVDEEEKFTNVFYLKNIKYTEDLTLPASNENDTAIIIYTSGTTNVPKGVMQTHKSLLTSLYGGLDIIPLQDDDNFLSVVSLSHTLELCYGLILPIFRGACVTYSKSLKYTTIFKNMKLAGITIMASVPLLFKILLESVVHKISGKRGLCLSTVIEDKDEIAEAVKKANELLGGKITCFFSGGAPLEKTIIDGFGELGIKLLQGYGLTETSGAVTITPHDAIIPGSAGKVLKGINVKIDSPDHYGMGEICVSGDCLMAGYYNNPETTAEAIRNGWFHTGDLGSFDSKGNLYITGRLKNIIVTDAGVNVFPEELEERIVNSNFINDVCIIGKQKPDRTESIHAVIVPDYEYIDKYKKEMDTGDSYIDLYEIIRKEIAEQTSDLAMYKKVLSFQLRKKELPRGRTEKVVRNQVQKEAFSIQGRLGEFSDAGQTAPIALINANIVTPFRIARKENIIIEDGKITQLGKFDNIFLPPNVKIIDLKGKYITPGFIDLHVHGGKGFSFNTNNPAELEEMLDFYISHGTTKLLATLVCDEKENFLNNIRNIEQFSKKSGKALHGLHLEGPFISKKMKGALSERFIWEASLDNWLELKEAGKDAIKMMTIAPELPRASEVMQVASQDNVCLAIAHSEARYEDIERAIDNGLSQVTHIFNAMNPMHHRTPGVVTAAMLKRELKVHLIADGTHVHPAVMKLLYKLKGPSGIVLISDAISATGMSDGMYKLADLDVSVRKGIAYLDNGKLAGSTLTMEKAVWNMIKLLDIPVEEAVRMATLNPARVLGLEHSKGILAVGKDADIVVLDEHFNVEMTLIEGEIKYSNLD